MNGWVTLASYFAWLFLGPYLVVWCAAGLPLAVEPRSQEPLREVGRAAFLASVPAALIGVTVCGIIQFEGYDPGLSFLLVPFGVAMGLMVAVLSLLFAIWLRLRPGETDRLGEIHRAGEAPAARDLASHTVPSGQ